MSLKDVKGLPSSPRSVPKKGPRLAKLTGLIDVGVHTREFKGELKKPKREFIPVFTLVNDTYETDEGETRHMTLSPYPIKIVPGSTRGHYSDFCGALDPEELVLKKGKGDLTKLVGKHCFLNVGHREPTEDGTVYGKILGFSAIPEEYPIKELPDTVEDFVFDLDEPDAKRFASFPDYIKEHIRGSTGYAGSALEVALESDPTKGKEEPVDPTDPDSTEPDSQEGDDDDDCPI